MALATLLLCSLWLICIYTVHNTLKREMSNSSSTTNKEQKRNWPPEVWLSEHDQYVNTRKAYGEVLRKHGPIVGVWRAGKLEYVVGREYIKEVLTQEHLFSFEKTAAGHANQSDEKSFSQDFRMMQQVLMDALTTRMESIVLRISAIYIRRVEELTDAADDSHGAVVLDDAFQFARCSVAEAILMTLLGEQYLNDASIKATYTAAAGLARLTVLHGSSSLFNRYVIAPVRTYTRFTMLILLNCLPYYLHIAPQIWKAMNEYEVRHRLADEDSIDLEPNLVNLLMKSKIDPKMHKISIKARFQVLLLILALIFASTHTTSVLVVWTLFLIAARPEHLAALASEADSIIYPDGSRNPRPISLGSLQDAKHLDSFIRETVRWRGLTLFSGRTATTDVPLGPYVIPKGAKIMPLSSDAHDSQDIYGVDAHEFNGFRFVDQDKPATMVGESYIPFGLGRYACPGRHLAVNGIKLIVLNILARFTPSLQGDTFTVVDPMYVSSVPPNGKLILVRRRF